MRVNEIFKEDYSVGFKFRTNIPTHAIVDPFKKKASCFAFFIKTKDGNKPVDAIFAPINRIFEISKNNYQVILNK